MDQASPAIPQSRSAVTIDRRTLFRTAWLYARWDPTSGGRKLKAVFPDALRRAWATLKDQASVESRVSAEAQKIIAEIRARKAAGTLQPIRQDESDERCDRDANLDMRFERFMAKTPAHTLRGVAVKLRALERHGGSWPKMDEPLFKTALAAVAELAKA